MLCDAAARASRTNGSTMDDSLRTRLEALNRAPMPQSVVIVERVKQAVEVATNAATFRRPTTKHAVEPSTPAGATQSAGGAGLLRRGEVVETPFGQHAADRVTSRSVMARRHEVNHRPARVFATFGEFGRNRSRTDGCFRSRIYGVRRGAPRSHDCARSGNLRIGRLCPISHRGTPSNGRCARRRITPRPKLR